MELLPAIAAVHVPLAPNDELVILESNIEIGLGQTGELETKNDARLPFVHVGHRAPGTDVPLGVEIRAGERALEELVHPLLDSDEILERIPLRLRHLVPPAV